MNEPAHGNGLRVSESKSPHSLEATSPNRECDSSVSPRIVGYNLINRHLLSPSKLLRDQDYELKGNGCHKPPPLGVELSGYRLLNMSVVFAFGRFGPTKAILTYMGRSAMPTTLDWVSGACLAVI